MQHGQATPMMVNDNSAVEMRMARLTSEYIDADRERKAAIRAELNALREGKIKPLDTW